MVRVVVRLRSRRRRRLSLRGGLQCDPAPGAARQLVDGGHSVPQQRHGHPVRRVLEARDVEDEHRVGGAVVPSDGREVARARL
jgi:hypothetical protein